MKRLAIATLLLAAAPCFSSEPTIQGFWQDTHRRILFSRDAPPGYRYGGWTALDQQQKYPSPKHITRSGDDFAVMDLLHDDDDAIQVLAGSDHGIAFARTSSRTGCRTFHQCTLESAELHCKVRTLCAGAVVWQGEERYARRASCERTQSRPEEQGIPSVCR